MKPLRFHGYSDDTFGEYGRTGQDFDDCGEGQIRICRVQDPRGEGLHVIGVYPTMPGRWPRDFPACWTVGIAPLVENGHLPPWPMIWYQDGYTPVLELDAPADVTLEWMQEEDP